VCKSHTDSAGKKGFRLYVEADTPSNGGIPRWYPTLEEQPKARYSLYPLANVEGGDADPNRGDTGKSNGERHYFWA
jgi:hypothetical protein